MTLSGKQLIGFRFNSEGTETFHAVDPANGESLEPEFYQATGHEVDEAFHMAEQAFASYRRKKHHERAAFLDKIGDEIAALGDELIDRCMLETGLPRVRLTGERTRTVNQLKLFAGVVREGSWIDARIDTADPHRQPSPKPGIRQMHIPLGPVGVFGAGNFPLAFSVAGGDTASALAAGCPVVFKAHPAHPGTSELTARAVLTAAQSTDMPEGVFSMVHGRSNTVGMAVVMHPFARAVGFTGSYAGGKALFDAAVRREEPIPVYAEMGSSNPVFILPGALKEKGETIARGLAASVTLGVGQFCTNPGLVFLLKGRDADAGAFVKMVADELAGVPAGVMLTKGIKDSYDTGIVKLTQIAGVNIAARGLPVDGGCRGVPYLLQTTAPVFIENPRLADEVFGPSTIIVIAGDIGQLNRAVSLLNGHLTASIQCIPGESEEYAGLIFDLERKVGRLIMNGFPTGVEVCPAMHHSGPFPATTDSRSTSVGTAAIKRFARPVCYQDFPPEMLPDELKDNNPMDIFRLVDGEWRK
jgi:alpha-ketoglutaric semialdehyde dehydrogenase